MSKKLRIFAKPKPRIRLLLIVLDNLMLMLKHNLDILNQCVDCQNGFRQPAVHFGQTETDSGILPCILPTSKKVLPICRAFWPCGNGFRQPALQFSQADFFSAQTEILTSFPQTRPVNPACKKRDINGGKPYRLTYFILKKNTMKKLFNGV